MSKKNAARVIIKGGRGTLGKVDKGSELRRTWLGSQAGDLLPFILPITPISLFRPPFSARGGLFCNIAYFASWLTDRRASRYPDHGELWV